MADQKRVDQAVAKFTRDILSIARENKVDFDYVGQRSTAYEEIMESLKVNLQATKDVLNK